MITLKIVNKILCEEYGLICKNDYSGDKVRRSYDFENRYMGNRNRVVCEVREKNDGGIGGYIYIGHLEQYENHPKSDARGWMKIGHMSENEFREMVEIVTRWYK